MVLLLATLIEPKLAAARLITLVSTLLPVDRLLFIEREPARTLVMLNDNVPGLAIAMLLLLKSTVPKKLSSI